MRIYLAPLLLGLTALAAGCGGKPAAETRAAPAIDFPDWVMRGSGAFSGETGKAFYGVGSTGGIKNRALAQSSADNRARAEIAKTMEVYSASLMKDYMASTTAGDMSASSEEQHVEQAIKTFSAATLSGVQITAHWYHPDGTVYSLAKLDLATAVNAAGRAKELNAQVRDYVRQRAEQTYDALAKEEDKHGGTGAPAPTPPPPPAPVATPAPAPAPVAPAPAPVPQPPAVVTPFGSTAKIEGALRGRIYYLPEGTSRLPDFGTLAPVGEVYATSIDVPPRSFDTGFPGITERFEWFAVRYDGEVTFATGGNYAFRTYSDDGSKLFLDGKLVIDNDGVHPPRNASGTVSITPGKHSLVLEYFQGPRYQIAVQLFVTPPGGAEQIFSTTGAASN